MLEFHLTSCKFYDIMLSTIVQNFIYTRLLTKKLQIIIHIIKPKITCQKKIHFNVLSFINEFNLLHKYLLEFYSDLLQVFMVLHFLQLLQNFIYTRLLTKKLQTIIHLIKPKITCKKNSL